MGINCLCQNLSKRGKHHAILAAIYVCGGCGGFFRVALFLVGLLYPAWWDAKHPEEFILDDGDSVYALPGSRSLYNDRARRVAVANEAMTKAIPVERIG